MCVCVSVSVCPCVRVSVTVTVTVTVPWAESFSNACCASVLQRKSSSRVYYSSLPFSCFQKEASAVLIFRSVRRVDEARHTRKYIVVLFFIVFSYVVRFDWYVSVFLFFALFFPFSLFFFSGPLLLTVGYYLVNL